MVIDNRLKEFKNKYISLSEIEQLYQAKCYKELVEIVKKLENKEIIKAINSKRNNNGMIPSLCLKYRINVDNEKKFLIENEIKNLAPYFAIDKYLKNIDKYMEHREVLMDLDYFFKHSINKLNVKLSKNERAFQIWGYEKMLDRGVTQSVVKFNNLSEKLNYYLTPEPFFDYVPKHSEKMKILIIENKDTWYTLRKIMTEKNMISINLLDITIEGLLYGEGNKITKENAIYDYEHNVINSKIDFYYWGDIDFTGIDLFERVKKANEGCNIRLFSNIYIKMLELSKNIKLNEILKNQYKVSGDEFFNELKASCVAEIKNILNNNKYIPQEILNYEELDKLITK